MSRTPTSTNLNSNISCCAMEGVLLFSGLQLSSFLSSQDGSLRVEEHQPLMMVFCSLERTLKESLAIHSPPASFLFVFETEINLCT